MGIAESIFADNRIVSDGQAGQRSLEGIVEILFLVFIVVGYGEDIVLILTERVLANGNIVT